MVPKTDDNNFKNLPDGKNVVDIKPGDDIEVMTPKDSLIDMSYYDLNDDVSKYTITKFKVVGIAYGTYFENARERTNPTLNIIITDKKFSDIYKINHAGGAEIECTDETLFVIKKAIKYAELSEGKFDVTIGQVTDLWNFQPEGGEGKIPEQAALNEALTHVDYKQIKVNGNKVSLSDPKGEIDLGGIAKGYIADKLAEFLKKKGVSSAVIDLGGNISVVGKKTDGKDFRIGVRDPFSTDGGIVGVVEAHDKSLVTSGTYERSFTKDGKVYHHILDVKTGYPVETGLDSVTVIGAGNKGIDCDSLATTCLILGEKDGKKLIESLDGYEAIFVQHDGTITTTKNIKGFEKTK